VVCAGLRERYCRRCHWSRIHLSSIRRPDFAWVFANQQIFRVQAELVLTNVAVLVLRPVLVLIQALTREQDDLHAGRQVPLVAQERLAFWLAVHLVLVPDVAVLAVALLVPGLQVVAEAERVPADRWPAVRHSVDRQA